MKAMTNCAAAAVALLAGSAMAQVETQWNFNGNLDAQFGNAILDYWSPDAQAKTTFGTATALAGPTPDGGNPNVALLDFQTDLEALVCVHDGVANGGGLYVNDYTLIMDIYIPQSSYDNYGWLSFYNTNASNSNDGDLFVNLATHAVGVSDFGYKGDLHPDHWHRLATTFETQIDGSVKERRFIDGTLVGIGETTTDGRYSLYPSTDPSNPWFHFFADNDGDMAPVVVSSAYFADFAMPASEIQALGCVSAAGCTSPGPQCSDQTSLCDTPADFNGDGVVDTRDVISFLNSWTQGCP
ncbi:MAG: hypothetical protein IPJ41_01365 [Phycisphaerales bacterium]|nr:hypothetical protein [Phycisphaerales bacterium]